MSKTSYIQFKSSCHHISQSSSNYLKNLGRKIVSLCLKIQEIFFKLFNNRNQSSSSIPATTLTPVITPINRSAIQPSSTEIFPNLEISPLDYNVLSNIPHIPPLTTLPNLKEIFAISAAPDAIENIGKYFNQFSKEIQIKILRDIQINFKNSIQWMKEIDQTIKNETNDDQKKLMELEKAKIVEEIHNSNVNLQDQLIRANPTIFCEQIKPRAHPCKGLYFYVYPNGMQIYIDHYLSKKEDIAHPQAFLGYEDFENKLKLIHQDFTTNEWHYTICCQDQLAINHEFPVLILREANNQYTALVIDSTGFNSPCENLYTCTSIIHNNLPGIEIYSSLYSRQADGFNCGFITLKDLKMFKKYKQKILEYFKNNAKPAEEFQDHLPLQGYDKPTSLQKLMKDYPESIKNLRLTQDLPIELMNPTQFSSKLDFFLKNPPKNTDLESLRKLEKKKSVYTVFDLTAKRDFYIYTKLEAIKYRWRIMMNAINP